MFHSALNASSSGPGDPLLWLLATLLLLAFLIRLEIAGAQRDPNSRRMAGSLLVATVSLLAMFLVNVCIEILAVLA